MTDETSIPLVDERDIPYPIFIREARYGGIYAGGGWALVAGLYHPEETTAAWGGDPECTEFWSERHAHGPEFVAEEQGRTRQAYAVSGGDPTALVEEMYDYYNNYEDDG